MSKLAKLGLSASRPRSPYVKASRTRLSARVARRPSGPARTESVTQDGDNVISSDGPVTRERQPGGERGTRAAHASTGREPPRAPPPYRCARSGRNRAAHRIASSSARPDPPSARASVSADCLWKADAGPPRARPRPTQPMQALKQKNGHAARKDALLRNGLDANPHEGAGARRGWLVLALLLGAAPGRVASLVGENPQDKRSHPSEAAPYRHPNPADPPTESSSNNRAMAARTACPWMRAQHAHRRA